MNRPALRHLLDQARTLCDERGVELLYLTLFGSTLYGTAIPGKSDLDVRGVFLPSPASLALNEAPHNLHVSTGDNASRNNSLDVDIDLWSVQHWLFKLLPAGDTGGLDVLFSPSHADCTLFCDSRLEQVFAHPLHFLNLRSGSACAAYSLNQAKKYGIKGSRLGALCAVYKQARTLCLDGAQTARLGDFIAALAAACPDGRFCRHERAQDTDSLFLCGKQHIGGISMAEFFHRLDTELARYGLRAQEAERNAGIDWKALSHAVRAIRQSEELLRTGRVRFPLACREELLSIKRGEQPWVELEARIVDGLERLEVLRATSPFVSTPPPDAARLAVLRCYGLAEEKAETAGDTLFRQTLRETRSTC